ncbi:MAG: transglutaminase-like domain-containing protein [Thermonemataceae bacterium]|nr:transglutaminase-like domain-containing protein [Thermonemataceae bacterium]
MIAENEIKALIALLDDDDTEVLHHVEDKILSLGEYILPFLTDEFEHNTNTSVQNKIDNLIHTLQLQVTRERLKEWVESDTENLLKGMWILANLHNPKLSYEDLSEKIEQLYYSIWLHFREGLNPYDQIKILNFLLFEEFGLEPNTQNFHSPHNNFIDEVLENKKGNPITLSVIYLLMAQKLQLPIFGVNLPNIFVLIYASPQKTFYINVFNKGLIFSRADIDNYIQQLGLEQHPAFYSPCSHSEILKRICRNLILAYEKLEQNTKKEAFQELLAILEEN